MPASAMIGSKHAQPAYQNRHLRPAQLEQLGAVDEQLLGRHAEANRKIVAETVGLRLQWLEAVRIGLFGGRIAPPGAEGHGDVAPRGLCGLLYPDRSAQPDEVSQAHPVAEIRLYLLIDL